MWLTLARFNHIMILTLDCILFELTAMGLKASDHEGIVVRQGRSLSMKEPSPTSFDDHPTK